MNVFYFTFPSTSRMSVDSIEVELGAVKVCIETGHVITPFEAVECIEIFKRAHWSTSRAEANRLHRILCETSPEYLRAVDYQFRKDCLAGMRDALKAGDNKLALRLFIKCAKIVADPEFEEECFTLYCTSSANL